MRIGFELLEDGNGGVNKNGRRIPRLGRENESFSFVQRQFKVLAGYLKENYTILHIVQNTPLEIWARNSEKRSRLHIELYTVS